VEKSNTSTKRILVVEDEPAIMQVCRRVLNLPKPFNPDELKTIVKETLGQIEK